MYPLFLSDFNETRLFSTVFEKSSYITFRENSFSASRIVPCDTQADVTKVKSFLENLRTPLQRTRFYLTENVVFVNFKGW